MIVGREAELAAVIAFVAGLDDEGDPLLLITGEPGVGKTTLLEEVLERSPEVCHVAATAIASEQGLAYSTLVSLLLARRHDLDRVPSPHREVLTDLVELGRPSGALQTGIALLALWAVLSEDGRVLLCIDDAQWCDAESARVVRFAVERLSGHGVGLVVVSHDDLLPGLEQARVLVLAPDESSTAADDWVVALTTALSPAAQQAFAVLALANRISPERLVAALHALGHEGDALVAELLSAGLATRTPSGLRPRRPLGRQAALALAGPADRRQLHRVLADVSSGGSAARRAWHLAEAGEDQQACVEWGRAGDEYAERHAHLPAAQAWRHAADLTTDTTARIDLLVAAGSAEWDAGRPDLAVATLTRAVDASEDVDQHAEVVDLLGQVAGWDGSLPAAVRLLTSEVTGVESSDPDRAVSLLTAAARLESLAASASAVALADRAEAIAVRATDFSRIMARTIGTHVRLLACDGSDLTDAPGRAGRARCPARRRRRPTDPRAGPAVGLRPDDPRGVRPGAHRAGAGPRRGPASRPVRHGELCQRDARRGRLAHGSLESLPGRRADRCHLQRPRRHGSDRSHRAGGRAPSGRPRWPAPMPPWDTSTSPRRTRPTPYAAATSSACRPCRPGVARRSGSPSSRRGVPGPLSARSPGSGGSSGRAVRRTPECSGGTATCSRRCWPPAGPARRDACSTSSTTPPSAPAGPGRAGSALRGHGILGRDAGLLHESARVLDRLGTPFEAARSRLAAAEHLGDVRGAVEAATVFESLGATPWLVRARAAGAPSASAEQSSPSLADLLTPAELRVALSVAEGLSNREVADHLAISHRTVDAHLQSIFRKLRVRGRTHLAVRVARES